MVFINHINTNTAKVYFFYMLFKHIGFLLSSLKEWWGQLKVRIGREINIDQGKVIEPYFLKAWDGEERRNKVREKYIFFCYPFRCSSTCFFFFLIKSSFSVAFVPTLFVIKLSRSKIYLETFTNFCSICVTVWKVVYFGLKIIVDRRFNVLKKEQKVEKKKLFLQCVC